MIPETLDSNPNPLPLMQLLPTELWQTIIRHANISPEDFKLVCQQFLQAWRTGVVAVYVHVPSGHALSFLQEERFNHFPNLRFVVLTGVKFDDAREQIARPLGPQQPRISFRLRLPRRLPPREVLAVLNQYPQLAAMVTHVSLEGGRFRFGDVAALLSALPQLSALELSGYDDLGDDELRFLATLPALRHLTLDHCMFFKGEGLARLMGPSSPIESLVLQMCSMKSKHLAHIAGTPGLHTLGLQLALSFEAGANDLVHLGSCPSIKRFMLGVYGLIEAEHMTSLVAKLPSLEWLDLSSCVFGDDEVLLALAPLQQLRYLNLYRADRCFSEEAVCQLAALLPELTEITISPPTSMLSLNLGTVRNAQGQPVTITTQARKF